MSLQSSYLGIAPWMEKLQQQDELFHRLFDQPWLRDIEQTMAQMSDVLGNAQWIADALPLSVMQEQIMAIASLVQDNTFHRSDFDYQVSGVSDFLHTLTWDLPAENEPEVLTERLTAKEQQVVADEFQQILESGKNWDQRFMESMKQWKETHPTIAAVLRYVVLPIVVSLISNILSSMIGQAMAPAKVYLEPASSSQVVYHLDRDQSVTIVGEAPYYFEIEVKDGVKERTVRGYVSKRSLQVTPQEELPPEETLLEQESLSGSEVTQP